MLEGLLIDEKFAEELAALVRHVRKNGLWDSRQLLVTDSLLYRTILVKNTSAFEIPPWGCMEVEGIANEDGQAYVKVKRPTAAVGSVSYLFNSDRTIEASTGNPYGVAQRGPIVRMLTDGSAITLHATWQPSIGTFEVKPGGFPFTAIGTDDVDTDIMKGVTNESQVIPSVIHFKSQGGGIPAISGSTMGSATCDRYVSSSGGVLSDSGTDVTIYNTAAAFAATKFGIAAMNDAGLWVAIVEAC